MKRLMFLATILFAFESNAQNYLISFAGTGASPTVNTVKVENLTAGTSLPLNGDDLLRLTFSTGINSIENSQSSEMKIYPNPMTDNSILQICPPEKGMAVITIFDMAGKMVSQVQSYLDNSMQEFRLSGVNSGFYLISVKGNTYQYSGSLLCNGKTEGTISIEKLSNNRTADEKIIKTDFKGVQTTVDMAYTIGDRLKFTGASGIYSTVITDVPASDKTITFDFIACTDGDNNNYPIVVIGTQTWMATNLVTTKYRNGDLIGTTTPATKNISGESTPKYQWAYGGDEGNAATYGRIYTWYAATDNLGVCPTGWHLPTEAEWTTLSNYLGGTTVAGNKLKETGITHWKSPNSGATNETGFTALPGGGRLFIGIFYLIGEFGIIWSATEINAINARASQLYFGDGNLSTGGANKKNGFSVRCLKD